MCLGVRPHRPGCVEYVGEVADVHGGDALLVQPFDEVAAKRVSCGRVRRNAVRVGVVVPTELGGTVRAVKELSSGFVEVVAVLIRNDEFNQCGSTHLYVSDVAATILKEPSCIVRNKRMRPASQRAPPLPTHSLRSFVEEGGSALSVLAATHQRGGTQGPSHSRGVPLTMGDGTERYSSHPLVFFV